MAQVAYEIPYSNVVNNHSFKNLVLKANPDEVAINPGRESLSLSKSTIAYLNAAFEKIKDEYVEAANNALAVSKDDVHLMDTFKGLVSKAPSAVSSEIDPVPFMSDNFKSLFSSNYYMSNHTSPSYKSLATEPTFYAATKDLVTVAYKHSYYKTTKPMTPDNCQGWLTFFDSDHVIIDLKSKFRKALNDQYQRTNLITWQKKGKADFDEAVKESKAFLDGMGIKYKLASELVTEEDVAAAIAPRVGLYASCIGHFGVDSPKEMSDADAKANTYLYVKMSNTTPIPSSTHYTFEEYLQAYRMLGYTAAMPKIRGVPKKYQSYVDGLTNWVDFETYIEKMAATAVLQRPSKAEANSPKMIHSLFLNEDSIDLYPDELKEYYEESRDYKAFINNSKTIHDVAYIGLMEKLGTTFDEYIPTHVINRNELLTIYPMSLPFIENYTPAARNLEGSMVSRLANLEKFYADAICNPKQRLLHIVHK
jgi:hypothetical protein